MGRIDELVYLISIGAEVDQVDQDGNTALIYTIIAGHDHTLDTLISLNASIEPTLTSRIPVTLACQYGRLAILENLLSREVKLVANMEGLFPLHLACREGRSEILGCLIAHGSDIEIKDVFTGWTPLFFAASEGHIECVRRVLAAGARVDVVDDSGWGIWTYSLYRGHLEVAAMVEWVDGKIGAGDMDEGMGTKVEELDLDDIPSLSLPPPIIPLRI